MSYLLYMQKTPLSINELQSKHDTCKEAMTAAPDMKWANIQPDLWAARNPQSPRNQWSIELEILE